MRLLSSKANISYVSFQFDVSEKGPAVQHWSKTSRRTAREEGPEAVRRPLRILVGEAKQTGREQAGSWVRPAVRVPMRRRRGRIREVRQGTGVGYRYSDCAEDKVEGVAEGIDGH
ncbi:hypothetical protein CRG98_010791 [Punica granatum]|uniref:Uncharacterized protein n=1 Tax=Punica granatum TaxID=22663 RepID=A0A2I0KJP7_PUNGR|nr:hypothetical protein CRG98_010791 [Punica granatum]